MRSLSQLLLKTFSRAALPYLKSYGLLHTAQVFNKSALVWEAGAESVLVLAPHMDDEVIGCGGTLAKHIARGASVTVAYLTDGAGGGVAEPGSTLRATRKREAHLALSALGIPHCHFLDAADGHLSST